MFCSLAEEKRLAILKEKEEAERAARLAEEARLRAAEVEKLKAEEVDAQVMFDNRQRKAQQADIEDIKAKEWEKYVECNKLPETSSWNELNTYLRVWHSEREETLEEALLKCEESEEVNCIYVFLYSSSC